MTGDTTAYASETLPSGATLARIALNAPARCNSLEPLILRELRDAFVQARNEKAGFVALTANGRHFSTGGDVAGFHASTDRTAYSEIVVGLLQDIVRSMLELPAIVVTGAQGATTGGSAGLLFASDIVILTEDAFIQPYYAKVGFAPDGGWAALLPERIGAGRALQIQLENRRIGAQEACELGLASRIAPPAEITVAVDETIRRLDAGHSLDAMRTAKALVWDEGRIGAVAARLDAERYAFKREIVRESTAAGMERFLGTL